MVLKHNFLPLTGVTLHPLLSNLSLPSLPLAEQTLLLLSQLLPELDIALKLLAKSVIGEIIKFRGEIPWPLSVLIKVSM